MREIKLIIQKEEDLLLLECAINWMRENNLKTMAEILNLKDKLGEKGKGFDKTIDMKIESYDRLMSLLAQLDNLIENR
jgi:hypothetical protein